MNKKLTEQIAFHIFAKFGIMNADFIDKSKTGSLIDDHYLLPETISFKLDDGNLITNKVFGCQMTVSGSEFKILLADCTKEKDVPEFCLYSQLKGSPAFAIYLILNSNHEVLIGTSTDKDHWIPCNTYLQALFLAGMENVKDIALNWTACKSYADQYKQMISFIQFHDQFFEEYNQ